MNTFDTHLTYEIPSDKREKYFELINELNAKYPHRTDMVDATKDPIVTFNAEHIGEAYVKKIIILMAFWGAKRLKQ
jgi:hypothetical protein